MALAKGLVLAGIFGIPELLQPALARRGFRRPKQAGNPARVIPMPEGIEPIQGLHLTRELARRSVHTGHRCDPGVPVGLGSGGPMLSDHA